MFVAFIPILIDEDTLSIDDILLYELVLSYNIALNPVMD
jgi:hypothetical protein